ncbi:hypothetical protein GW766_02905 [Candidatus Parcubacteria bacterium]|nr:hypothetical protein [Candidatus Parcubacteria bacterium]
MIPKGLFTQIGAVIVSIGIIVTYVKPSFAEIELIQNDIALYQKERSSVLAVNSQLSSLVAQMQSVSIDDQKRLLAYLPDKIDELYISRDLLIIAQSSGVLYKDMKYIGKEESSKSRKNIEQPLPEGPIPHKFSLSVEGTYEQIKNLFNLIARSNYPLEVQGAKITKTDGGFLSLDLDLVTYSFNEVITDEEITL